VVNFVSEDELKHIVFVVKMKAENGDMAAAKLLFQYVLGKPTDAVDPDRLDVDEWQKWREQARPTEEMQQVTGRLPAYLMCDLTKTTWPCEVAQQFAMPLLAGIQAMDARDAQRAAGSGDPRPAQGDPRPAKGSGDPRPAQARAARREARAKRRAEKAAA